MKIPFNNPIANKLPQGLDVQKVIDAVNKSGYPLQTIVTRNLKPSFFLQEEWSFVDKETQDLRTLDIFASKRLYEFSNEDQPRIRPILNLLIECKRSELPYIFFLSESQHFLMDFPLVVGLSKDTITITSDDDPSTWSYSALHALGLLNHPFINKDPFFCTTFSKCVRKGSDLDLSGSESYHGLMSPIVKALQYFEKSKKPPKTAYYFDAHLALGIGVLDAPMLGVKVNDHDNEPVFLPWVRVLKHESYEDDKLNEKSRLFAIDLVHKDYLNEYIDSHLLPFAEEFAKQALKHQTVLASSEGFVSGMGNSNHFEIEPQLTPSSVGAKLKRNKAIVKNIAALVIPRKKRS